MVPLSWRWGDPPAVLENVLGGDGVVAIPSESSYGLAADPSSAAAVAAVYRLKRRPADKPLLVVAASRDQLAGLGIRAPHQVLDQLAGVWPAALTAVLPIERPLPASCGSLSLAVRVPAHRRLRELLRALGPLTSTSANPAGAPPFCSTAEVTEWLAGEAGDLPTAVVDDGDLPGGSASTVVAWESSRWRLLRQGAVAWPPVNETSANLLTNKTSSGSASSPAD
nr:threonylcarbamoyl-AMP synthase-like [Nerophis lumbriciformis]